MQRFGCPSSRSTVEGSFIRGVVVASNIISFEGPGISTTSELSASDTSTVLGPRDHAVWAVDCAQNRLQTSDFVSGFGLLAVITPITPRW